MKKLLLLLGLITIFSIASAQTSTTATPLAQTAVMNAELILPNSVISNPEFNYYQGYEIIKQTGSYLITPSEMQAAGFINGDEITSLAWTITLGQQIQTTGAFTLDLSNTIDVTNTTFYATNTAEYALYSSTLTIPSQAGTMAFQFQNPFTYTGGGIYVSFGFETNGYSGYTPLLQTAINTNSVNGYRGRNYTGGEFNGSFFNNIHSNRPVTTLGKATCPFAGNYNSSAYTDNSNTLTWVNTTGNFEVEYGIRPYTQGSGGTVIPQVNITAETPTYVLNNLLPATLYDVYVRRICSPTNKGFWKKSFVATTISTPITTLPYVESFSGSLITSGWTNINNPSSYNWAIYIGNFLGMKDVQGVENNRTIYSRSVQLNANTSYTLTFSYRNNWLGIFIPDSENSADLNVLLNSSLISGTPTILSTVLDIANPIEQLATVTFTVPINGLYYIGFNGIFPSNPTTDPTYAGFTGFNYLEVNDFNLDTTLEIEENLVKNIALYPNPTHSILNIQTDKTIEEVSIIDISGRTTNVKLSENNTIDVSNLSSGIYFIVIKTTEGFYREKFIKN